MDHEQHCQQTTQLTQVSTALSSLVLPLELC
eukprot:SAG22_NODE_6348_length_867_cov_1.205729_1_plen_30_part_10